MSESIPLIYRLFITLLAFSIFAIIMFFINAPLFDVSMEVITNISKSWNSSFTTFMRYFTDIALMTVIGVGALYVLLKESKIAQMMFFDTLMLSWFVAGFLKNLINEVRPCWKDEKLLVEKPEIDYGNPSGHSLFALCSGLSCLLIYGMENKDFYLTEFEANLAAKRRTGVMYSPKAKVIIVIITLFICTMIVYSRVHIGLHSINQVLHGGVLAILCTCTIFFSFRKELVALYEAILTRKKTSNLRRNTVLCFLLAIFGILAQIILYIILSGRDVKLSEDIVNRIKKLIETFTSTTPLEAGLLNGCIGSFTVGIHLGLLFGSYCLKINAVRCSMEISLLKRIIRLLFTFTLIAVILFFPYFFTPPSPVLGFVWVKIIIPVTLAGFILYGLGDYIAMKIGCLPELPSEELTMGAVKVEA